ncbi:MAG: hypothetical protein ACE5E8_10750, partial [Acidimicrobiia bacterium]
MALLQNDKAIFYHPLNDSTEFLQSQAWALGSGSLAGAGKISLALSGEAGDTLNAFGTQGEFVANDADHIKIAALSSTVVVVIYSNNSASQAGTAKVGTVSGTDITFGSATEFDTGDVDQTFVARVDATKCVVCWRDLTTGSVGFGRARIGTVTGTSIAFGTTATYLSANSASANSIAVLSTSLFVVCYQGPSATIRANAGAISGTTISFGAQGTI